MAKWHKKDRAKVREGLKCRNPQRKAKSTGLTKKGNPSNKLVGQALRRWGGLIERIHMTEPGLLEKRGDEVFWKCPWCKKEMATPQQFMRNGRSYQGDFSKRLHLDECEEGGKGKTPTDAKIEQLRLGIGKQQTQKQRGYRPGTLGLVSTTSMISLKKRREKVRKRARTTRPSLSWQQYVETWLTTFTERTVGFALVRSRRTGRAIGTSNPIRKGPCGTCKARCCSHIRRVPRWTWITLISFQA